MYCYLVYGLFVVSDLSFPGLMPIQEAPPLGAEPVVVKMAPVNPEGISALINKGLFHQANEQELWLYVPPIGHFLITGGISITVAPNALIDEDSLCEFILNTCIGALLLQRRFLVLQGCSIRINETCFALIGNSGMGKSTLAAAFFQRGYSILTDDFTPINAQGQVLPGTPYLKLWRQTLRQLKIKSRPNGQIRPKIQKWRLPLNQQFYAKPLTLSAVFVLEDQNQAGYSWSSLTGIKKMLYLQELGFRRLYLQGLTAEKHMLLRSAQIAKNIKMTKIIRPHEAFNLEECVAFIENDLRKQDLLYG